jgi:hypothetical protein
MTLKFVGVLFDRVQNDLAVGARGRPVALTLFQGQFAQCRVHGWG